MTANELDVWRAKRCRDLEQEVASLKRYRDHLERLLAVCLHVATGGTNVEPLALLAVLEAMEPAEMPT